MGALTREAVVALAKQIGARHGGTVTYKQLKDEGGLRYADVVRLFGKGGYREVRKRAGMREPVAQPRIGQETLMEEFHRVAGVVGRVSTVTQVCRYTGRAPRVVRRLGGRKEIKERYAAWLKGRGLSVPWAGLWKPGGETTPRVHVGAPGWRSGLVFGEPIDLRGMRHAPVNEMGVVALFGALAEDLGFLIEAVRVRFPDCEAKRLVDARAGRWERVLIEFEYWSSGFKMHGHDAKGCDLIVCWEHDWKECPMPVLELKREVMRMKERRRCA